MEMEEKEDKMKRKTPDKNLLRNWEVYYQESWTDDQIPQRQMQQAEAEKGGGQEKEKKQKEDKKKKRNRRRRRRFVDLSYHK